MTHNPTEGTTIEKEEEASAARHGAQEGTAKNPAELMQQLATLFNNQGATDEVQSRLEELQKKLDSLSQRVGSTGETGQAAPGPGTFVVSDKILGTKFKKLLTSVLFESGILEKFVSATVEHKLSELNIKPGAGSEAGTEDLRNESTKLVKEFLAKNLGSLFQSEIRGAIQKELQAFLASENMKVLIDDKFRALQLYLTTEVIPNTLKQLLNKSVRQKT